MSEVSLIDGHIDNGMTDEDIIKALECCIIGKNGCKCCPLWDFSRCSDECENELTKETIDLINRQKEEIERLEDKLEEKSTEIKTLIPTIDRLMKINKAEVIEHLKKINFNAFPKEVLNAIKSEAIKEFAKRLKKELSEFDMSSVGLPDYDRGYKDCMTAVEDVIDNLVNDGK